MAENTQSIASNMIDPTNYVQGGGVVDGKLGFENIPEDWVMYVQLFVKPRNRSVLLKSNEDQIIASDNQEFLVANIPYYKQTINKNTSGDIIPFDVQTTEYTDIFGAKGLSLTENGTPSSLGQESAFGITRINIDFATIRQPVIEIDFVDVRGAGLTSYGPSGGITKSPYSWFFLLPYPEFCLKVKGFYGKTISIPCLMHKFTMRYNNNTGNFEISAKFAGYPFSALNDISIKLLERMCCIPGGTEELENVYNKLKNCLDPTNPDEKIILDEMPRIDDLCLWDYIRAIEQGKLDNPIQQSYSKVTRTGDYLTSKYNELIKSLNQVLALVRDNGGENKNQLYNNFGSLLIQCRLLESEFQELFNTASNTEQDKIKYDGLGGTDNKNLAVLNSTGNQATSIPIKNFSHYISDKKLSEEKFKPITLKTSNSYFDPCITDGDITIEQDIKDGMNNILSDTQIDPNNITKTIETNIPKDRFKSAMNSGSAMNAVEKSLLMLRDQYQSRLELLQNYQIFLCNFFQTIEKDFKKEFTEVLKVRPTLQRVITLIAINTEAFFNLLLKTSIKAEKYHDDHKQSAIYASYFTDSANQEFVNQKGKTNNRSASLRDIKLYAWPKTYKFDGEGKKVEAFPTELSDEFSEWPEVQFTKSVVDSIASNECNHSKLIQTTGGGLSRWKALNVFEDAPLAINKPRNSSSDIDSPYNNDLLTQYIATSNASDSPTDNERENKFKQLIVSRALINLFYLNHLFEQDGDGISESNKLAYDSYVSQLAQRDVETLISTLTQCNSIKLLSEKFSSDAGVTLLQDYCQNSIPLTFSSSLTYTAPTNLQTPYGMLFFFGNNNTRIKVTDNGKEYSRRRSSNENFNDVITNNFYGLSFYDKPQYPFKKYVTIYLSNQTILNGYEYDEGYQNSALVVPITQGVIYNYNPWYQTSYQITPPLGIPLTNIINPELPRNIYYNKSDIVRYVTYEPFLNPSHIRDISVFGFTEGSKLPYEQPQTIDPIYPESPKFETGNGIPSWRTLFSLMSPSALPTTHLNFPIGITGFDSYKIISPSETGADGIIKNDYHPMNRFDGKTYYIGVDPLLYVLSNTVRVYHTTYNHYLSDTFKSFLWDPYKTKIGNTSTNKLGSQDRSAYNIVTNLDKSELRDFTLTNYDNQIIAFQPIGSTPLMFDWKAGSYWGEDNDKSNTGFQNAIFYSSNRNIQHSYLNKELPILYHIHSDQSHQPSLIQYLFTGDQGGAASSLVPSNSKWLKDFGEDAPLGVDYSKNTFTMKNMFGGASPFNQASKYFLSYVDLTNDNTKGLSTHSFYDIPNDMNSTWFRTKMREFQKNVTPVKKYQTTYMKKLSYLIWKEATMRILSMCEINLMNGGEGISGGQYFNNNKDTYTTVYLVDDPTKRSGGPTTATTLSLFTDTYPQSKFYNSNIDVYAGNNNYGFYKFQSDITGTYTIGTSTLETFNGLTTPGPNGQNAFYPNDNPTDAFVAGSPLTYTQPPLLTSDPSQYVINLPADVIKTPQWSRMYIHQTEWWANMTTDSRLTVDSSIDEVRIMKTYLTLMSLWGANSMDALVYNYPLMSPASGMFRTNNIDLVTLGAFLWASESKLINNTDYVKDIINTYPTFSCPTFTNPNLILNFGDPQTAFPFSVKFKDTTYNITALDRWSELDRWSDYGVICTASENPGIVRGATTLNGGATMSYAEQIWNMVWSLGTTPTTYDIKPSGLSEDVKRDLVNNFLQFASMSDFSENVDDNLKSLSMLREVAEIALRTVENSDGEQAYHNFPFDIEQTLLIWGDWASIVDLNDTTKNFKSYYDNDDGWRVKRPEQKTILSSKLFDMLAMESSTGTIDNPFKEVKTYDINGATYYYSPWVRAEDDNLLMLEGDIGKKIMMKLMKVITYEEQAASTIPIISKRNGQFETILNYKQSGISKTLAGNDQNYFFENLFKGFYFPTIYGGMRTTNSSNYDASNLGGQKLYLTKSWRECVIPGMSDADTIQNIVDTIPNSNRLETYFKTFCGEISKLTTGENNEKCKKGNKVGSSQTYQVDFGADTLIFYRLFKNLFNRWLAGTSEEEQSYQRSGCNNLVGGNNCNSLIKNIFIVDRVGKPAGNLVCINSQFMANWFNDNPQSSIMGFLSEMVSKEEGGIGGFITEYPTFFNFGSSGINMEENPGKAMWGMTSVVDTKYGGPAIVVCVQKTDQSEANAELNSYVNEEANVPDDFHTPDSRGVMFKVVIGNENNNIFTNLQIDTQEFKQTWESIVVLDQYGKEISTGTPKFLDQNLYNLWEIRSWTATIECFGNMLIQPMMYFYLENIPVFRGTYVIKKVQHSIEGHTIKTKFWGSRVNTIPFPYVNKGAVGSYYQCQNSTIGQTPDTVNNDPGYCKETMLEILAAFVAEVQDKLDVAPIVYTSDEFLTALGFTEDDSKTFYDNYQVMVRKDGNPTPFGNVNAISITQDEFNADFIETNFPTPLPQPELMAVTGKFTVSSAGWVIPAAGTVGQSILVYQPGESRKHQGIDIKNVEGTPVMAVWGGIVEYMSPIVSRDENSSDNGCAGNYIVIKHTMPNGTLYYSRYLHLRKGNPFVAGLSVNNVVAKGDLIGYMGDTGHSTTPHLHFELLKDHNYPNGKVVAPETIIPEWDVKEGTYVKA